MASYSPKLNKKEFNNWFKAQLAVLLTKEGIEPFVYNEIQAFQLECLDNICYNNKLINGSVCSSCSTENIITCPTYRICNVGHGNCSYHRNSETQYNPAGCPNKICDKFNTQIKCAHRYYVPSYKNTDATQWCSSPWEVAKCFMPPDGYADKVSPTDTDFNGIISIISNFKDFSLKLDATLSDRNNIFEQAREIGRRLRHSSRLEVTDKDLQQYFKVLRQLLSDSKYLVTDKHAQIAKQNLIDLENDSMKISKGDVDKALGEAETADLDKIRTEIDDLKKLYEIIKLDTIKTTKHAIASIREVTEKGKQDLSDLAQNMFQLQSNKNGEQYDNRQRLKNDLIALYKTNYSSVPLSPLVEEYDSPLAGFYVMPEIHMQTDVFARKKETARVKSFEDLFSSGSKIAREIYLSADAGFGKTAFSKYLATAWCQAHQKDGGEICGLFKEEELKALAGFEFAFLVLLKDSANVCDIDIMIDQQIIGNLPCTSSLPENLFKEILDKEKCLIILDGLDEWTHPRDDCKRLPKNIPHRYARENCVILTTTRPWKLGDVNLKKSQTDKIIELIQLNDESARTLTMNGIQKMKKGLDADELASQTSKLHKVIFDRGLNDLKSVPLILMYIISLWCDGKPIGESKCQVYTSIIELLLTRTVNNSSDLNTAFEQSQCTLPKCFEELDTCQKCSTLIAALGKLAFNMIFSDQRNSTQLLDKSIAKNYLGEDQSKFFLKSGLLTESTAKTLTERKTKISFPHKTVQEYFCAIHVSIHSLNDGQKTIVEKCRRVQHVLDISSLLIFISGMNPSMISVISYDLMHVINSDEETKIYRTMAGYDYRYIHPLLAIQNMYMSCDLEFLENKDFKLCLQDVFISENCREEKYVKRLNNLCHQNKGNIKSISVENRGICSLQNIIEMFAIPDIQKIEKLWYKGEIVEEEMMKIVLGSLKCLSLISRKWRKTKFVSKGYVLSTKMNDILVKLQNLDCLYIENFTMSHEVMKTFFDFLARKKSMKDIRLFGLYCMDHKSSCRGLIMDLAGHSNLRCLALSKIPLSQLKINIVALDECYVGEIHETCVLSSYLNQLATASKLQSFWCGHIASSSAIEALLQTIPLLLNVKEVWMSRIDLGERTITLSPHMGNIELVYLMKMKMSCAVLQNLISDVNKLARPVAVYMRGCEIKPEATFEEIKNHVKTSEKKFTVTYDGIYQDGNYAFFFRTIKGTGT